MRRLLLGLVGSLLVAGLGVSGLAGCAGGSAGSTFVPDLTLRTAAEAKPQLENAGLVLGAVGNVATGTIGPGLIASQSPPAASPVSRRSAVDVWLAVQPSQMPVPAVTGLDRVAALSALDSALYLPQVVDVFHATAPNGTVVQQAPAAGRSWMTGRPVFVTVSVGPDDGTGVAVPDLKGMDVKSAATTLTAQGLQHYELIENPTAVRANVVKEQLPEAGTLVRPQTTVLVLATVE